MGYKGLITLDLPGATSDEREKFYAQLKTEKWKKIENLTTAWKVSFNDDVERSDAMAALKSDISKAKKHSSFSDVKCAIQLGKGSLYADN